MNLVNTCKQLKFMDHIHAGMPSNKMNTEF